MNPYNSYNDPEGDWDEREDLSWNEFDWQRYLKEAGEEIRRFLSLYSNAPEGLNRIDEVAHLMGWDEEEWARGDVFEEEDFSPAAESATRSYDGFPEGDEWDPYTLHQHPVYIVTKGLFDSLGNIWECYLKSYPGRATPHQSWQYARNLNEGETNALMALQALDMGDYALAVCHLKQVLRTLNQSFTLLQQTFSASVPGLRLLHKESCRRLFDLREVYLRVIQDCREEIENHPSSED